MKMINRGMMILIIFMLGICFERFYWHRYADRNGYIPHVCHPSPAREKAVTATVIFSDGETLFIDEYGFVERVKVRVTSYARGRIATP